LSPAYGIAFSTVAIGKKDQSQRSSSPLCGVSLLFII
jgi:hypothetical protein